MQLTDLYPDTNDRANSILLAAFGVFCQYGYRRTSMEDIARAAGMSRAALYLHYKNKQDILRQLVAAYFARALRDVQTALEPGGKPKKVLAALFEAKGGPEMQALMSSPHAAELWDANNALCADEVRNGEANISMALTEWLTAESSAGRLRLASGDSPQMHAEVILGALSGIKNPELGYAEFQARAKRLAWFFGRALTA